jgi:hypothetical protein
MKSILQVFICLLIQSISTHSQVVVNQDQSGVLIKNEFTALYFDTVKGTYSAVNLENGKKYLTDASFRIESLSSSEAFLKYSWEEEVIMDSIGTGRKLVFTASKSGLPDMIFEVTLYTGRTFFILNCGINNKTEYPVMIKSFHPLRGITEFSATRKDAFFVLDGNAGGENTAITTNNELQCRNNLLCTYGNQGKRKSFVAGGLTYHEFEKFATLKKMTSRVNEETNRVTVDIDIYAQDPVGKLVDPGVKYIPDDKFYLDFCTSNPLESLEQYGQILRAAQNIKLNVYDFPTFCLWYGGMDQYGGGPKNNDSPGAVWETEQAVSKGILGYSGFAVRLVPDNADQQGWWDDEHFQKFGNTANYIGPCYKPPYETTQKWGQAAISLGGIPFMYSRSGWRSEDFCQQHPDYMLYNNPSKGYDFTDPGFIEHLQKLYAAWREAGIKGMMFDYPSSGWAPEGGFEDNHATAASAYRNIFKIAFKGLGPESYMQENKLSRGSDITLGVVASQRTAGDADMINPLMVSRDGLRWYKNRVVVNYDKDAKNPDHATPLNRDGWRTMCTMSYVTGGRFLLGLSFSKISDDHFFDLTRIFPSHKQPRSARPVDAFTGIIFPRVYDFIVNKDWHQVTLYNTSLDDETYIGTENFKYPAGNYIASEIDLTCSGEPGFGGLGLDPKSSYYVYDFWNEKFVGKFSGADTIKQLIRPGESRMLSIHKIESNPQFISTNRHIMQGYVDMVKIEWDERHSLLKGISRTVAGETYKIIVACNGRKMKSLTANDAKTGWIRVDEKNELISLSIDSNSGGDIHWAASFR